MFPVEQRFTIALHAGARAWRAALERHLKANGLTAAGWNALAALAGTGAPGADAPDADAPGADAPDADKPGTGAPGVATPPSQRELARRLGVDGATLVSTIDRLVAAGLVERLPGPHDRRVKLVALTAAGRELAGRIELEAARLRSALAERIDGARLDTAAAVLEEMRHILERA